jgi:hypothetical protein
VQRITSLLVLCAVLAATSGARADEPGALRVDGLVSRSPDRILVFVVRDAALEIAVSALQDVVRRTIDAHLFARVVSAEETFVATGDDLQKRLRECKGDDGCFARLAGSVDARYLLVVTANRVGELDVVGVRLIDLAAVAPIGSAVDPLPPGMDVLEALPARIQAAVPPDLWDPYGALVVRVDQPGAEVTVNGKVVGVTPLEKVGFLLPATYRLSVAKRGFVRAEAEALVTRGEDALVAFTLEEEDTELLPWWAWTLLGVGVAAGAGVGIGLAVSGGGAVELCSSPDPAACAP